MTKEKIMMLWVKFHSKTRGIKTYAVPYGDGIKNYDNSKLAAGGTDITIKL